MSTFGQSTTGPALEHAVAPATVPRTGPWIAAGVGAVVVVVAAGWFGVVGPQRTTTSDLRASTAQVEANEQALAARVTDLKQEFAALPEHQAKLASLEQQLPADAALPELVRGLRDVAARSGVQLTSLTPSAPVVAGGDAASTAQPAGAGTTDAAAAGTTTTGAASGTATADAAATGLLQIPVTVTASGSYSALVSFLQGIQQEQRLLLVTGTNVAPAAQSTGAGDLALTITGAVFALPTDATATAASADAGAAAAPAAGAPAGTTTTLN